MRALSCGALGGVGSSRLARQPAAPMPAAAKQGSTPADAPRAAVKAASGPSSTQPTTRDAPVTQKLSKRAAALRSLAPAPGVADANGSQPATSTSYDTGLDDGWGVSVPAPSAATAKVSKKAAGGAKGAAGGPAAGAPAGKAKRRPEKAAKMPYVDIRSDAAMAGLSVLEARLAANESGPLTPEQRAALQPKVRQPALCFKLLPTVLPPTLPTRHCRRMYKNACQKNHQRANHALFCAWPQRLMRKRFFGNNRSPPSAASFRRCRTS